MLKYYFKLKDVDVQSNTVMMSKVFSTVFMNQDQDFEIPVASLHMPVLP